MNKSSHPFMQMLVMAGISLLLMLAVSVLMVLGGMAGADLYAREPGMVLLAVMQAVSFLLPPVLMVRWYHAEERKDFWKLDFSGRKWLLALAGVVVVLLFAPLSDWLSSWNDGWNFGPLGDKFRAMQEQSEGEMERMLGVTSVGGLLLNLLVAAVVPAVCEEAFFRVGIQGLFRRWTGNAHVAVWVTAAIFSMVHLEMFSFMPRLLMGALLGYLFEYGGSFVVNSAAHFANNAVVVVLYWLAARGVIDMEAVMSLDLGTLTTVCCTLAATALFLVVFPGRRIECLKC